jgi:predicted DNA-binding transcriptional regulator AlpA
MAEQEQLLTGAEFATMARVTIRAVRKWADRGIGPRPVRPSGSRIVRYRRSEVEEWLSGERTGTRAAS